MTQFKSYIGKMKAELTLVSLLLVLGLSAA